MGLNSETKSGSYVYSGPLAATCHLGVFAIYRVALRAALSRTRSYGFSSHTDGAGETSDAGSESAIARGNFDYCREW
jgi:hypothetical protein